MSSAKSVKSWRFCGRDLFQVLFFSPLEPLTPALFRMEGGAEAFRAVLSASNFGLLTPTSNTLPPSLLDPRSSLPPYSPTETTAARAVCFFGRQVLSLQAW